MDELTTDTGAVETIGRRDMLKRSAFVVGAAALWSTPVVQTLGMRAAAASTPVVADFCPQNQGKITSLSLQYTAKGCGHILGQGAADEGCTGQSGDLPLTAYVVIRVGSTGNNVETFAGSVTAYVNVIDTGIPLSPQASTWMHVYDEEGGTLLASQRFHTSCSEEIFLGEEYGPVLIHSGTWEPN